MEKNIKAEDLAKDNGLDDMVAESDTGARNPGYIVAAFMGFVALCWSLLQLWVASPLPFILDFFKLNSTQLVSIHLAFGVFLAFLAYPAKARQANVHIINVIMALVLFCAALWAFSLSFRYFDGMLTYTGQPKFYYVPLASGVCLLLLSIMSFIPTTRTRIPTMDWLFAVVGAFCAAYIYLFYRQVSTHAGDPDIRDMVVFVLGITLLFEATRRALGPALVTIAAIFLAYCFMGQYAPGFLAWHGATFGKVTDHQWISQEGVFGVPINVSATLVFLFVLFGAMLDKAGAGNYFIKIAFGALGHYRGGPAKAAVIASAATGVISGSSIANVVTTGTFTIPMMKRVGFTPEKAGAVEVASSVNGQLMPPVMGAAAFLIAANLKIDYSTVIKHAIIPALISYIALVYIVHLEALKNNIEGLKRRTAPKQWWVSLLLLVAGVSGTVILSAVVYYGLGWQTHIFGDSAIWIVVTELLVAYLGLLYLASRSPDLEVDDPEDPVIVLPIVKEVAKTGYYYLLPVVLLIWLLMVNRLSPDLSAFWACVAMIFVLLTQRSLKAVFRRTSIVESIKQGAVDLYQALVGGSRNMVGIALATATAGVIVGTVSLTGVGGVLAQIVEQFSFGSVFLMLIWTAILSLILGMGLPTTANYIVVSSLLAPIIVSLGAQNGFIVPLVAAHFFVFYYGIMADVTPPVGLASFAAAAISGGDPLKTGAVAFFYSLRTAILPFLFIFNTQILLINVGWAQGILVFIIATIAILVFTAASQGYFLVKSKVWESLILLLAAFTFFRPGYWNDLVWSPYTQFPLSSLTQVIEKAKVGSVVRVKTRARNRDGEEYTAYKKIPILSGKTAAQRLGKFGLDIEKSDDGKFETTTKYASQAEKDGFRDVEEIKGIDSPNTQPPKEIWYILAALLLGFVIYMQRSRKKKSLSKV